MLNFKYTYTLTQNKQMLESAYGTIAAESIAVAKGKLAKRYEMRLKNFEIKHLEGYGELHTCTSSLRLQQPKYKTLIVSAEPLAIAPNAPDAPEADAPDGEPAPMDTLSPAIDTHLP